MKYDEEEYTIDLTLRQRNIVSIVTNKEPVSGEYIAEQLNTTRPAIRSDLALLVMLKYLEAKPKVGYTLGRTKLQSKSDPSKLQLLRVKDFQSTPVILRETATVSDAVVTMFLENVGSLIIVGAEGYLTGIVSRKDLLKVTLGNSNAVTMPVGLIMTRYPNIVTVSPEETIIVAAQKMIEHEVDSLPVVRALNDEKDQRIEVLGRITKTGMTKVLLMLGLDQ